ncbi:sugar kinase [Paenibacillus sp. FSL H8-0537]|uniref:sugar kinase n=1 Tax=Paenibacillus sp. FSL H8-0537 TaxID=2921399 RepID=UPI00310140DB
MSRAAGADAKFIVVKRKTRLEELLVRYNTVQQAKFYIERLGADFGDYWLENDVYQNAVSLAVSELEQQGRVQVLDREHVPSFLFGDHDIVVAIGPDGLVAGTLKYLDRQPLIGVNPEPQRWEGVLLPFTVGDLRLLIPEVLRGKRRVQPVTLAMAQLNNGQCLYGVNDLFIGRKTHVSARYEIKLEQHAEQHSSSGIIVSTGLGASGWLRSILAGAAGIVSSATHQPLTLTPENLGAPEEQAKRRLDWSADSLYFTVREPFPSRTTAASIVFGQINGQRKLRITSQMPEDGVIFSDGVESDFLTFHSGLEATIGPADRQGHLVI